MDNVVMPYDISSFFLSKGGGIELAPMFIWIALRPWWRLFTTSFYERLGFRSRDGEGGVV